MNLIGAIAAALLSAMAPHGAAVLHGIAYAPGPRGGLDVYLPRHAAPDGLVGGAPVAVFVYGGSWQSGDRAFYRFVGQLLAARGIVTAIPDYRVYPEVRWPDFLRDNAQAVRFVKDHARQWGADPSKLFLVGHSAGAYDVAMLALDARWLGEAGLDPRRDLAGVVGLAGPYDFLPLRDAKLKIIFGPASTLADTQPINHVGNHVGDDGGAAAPPMLLLAGRADTVVDPGNTPRLAAAIRARGGDVEARLYPGVGHAGLLTAMLAPFRHRAPTLAATVGFIEARSATAPARVSVRGRGAECPGGRDAIAGGRRRAAPPPAVRG